MDTNDLSIVIKSLNNMNIDDSTEFCESIVGLIDKLKISEK